MTYLNKKEREQEIEDNVHHIAEIATAEECKQAGEELIELAGKKHEDSKRRKG